MVYREIYGEGRVVGDCIVCGHPYETETVHVPVAVDRCQVYDWKGKMIRECSRKS